MILFRVQLRVPHRVRDDVIKSLLRLVGPTRAARGCTACGCYVDAGDEDTLVYTEEWEAQEALDGRLRTQDLRILLSALDLCVEPPVVRFDTIAETHGMDVIAAARAETGGGT